MMVADPDFRAWFGTLIYDANLDEVQQAVDRLPEAERKVLTDRLGIAS